VATELDRAAASRQADAAQQQVESLSTEKQALAKETMTDGLTQIANRKYFDKKISECVSTGRESGELLGLIMYDLDHFKKINDTYGHLFGDEVLKAVGQVLQKFKDQNQLPARYGGEEFAIICPNTTLKNLIYLAEQVRREIANLEMRYGTQLVKITTSAGAAYGNPRKSPFEVNDLIEKADRCLMQAKDTGRNQTRVTQL